RVRRLRLREQADLVLQIERRVELELADEGDGRGEDVIALADPALQLPFTRPAAGDGEPRVEPELQARAGVLEREAVVVDLLHANVAVQVETDLGRVAGPRGEAVPDAHRARGGVEGDGPLHAHRVLEVSVAVVHAAHRRGRRIGQELEAACLRAPRPHERPRGFALRAAVDLDRVVRA